MFGIVLGIYFLIAHLAGLLSFGMPYLMPFVKKKPERGVGDGILRMPFQRRWQRPLYAKRNESVRLRKKTEEKN